MEKPSMLTFFFTLFLLSLCTTVTSLTKIVFFTGKDITLTCDLPIEKTSTIIWRDWMFNEAHEPHELFSSLNPTIVDKRITISNDYKQITFKSMLKSGEVSCVVKTNDQVDLKKFHITAIETNPKCEGSEEYDEGQPLNNKCGVVTDGSVSLITHPAVKSVDVDSFDEVAIRLDEPASQKLDGVKVECRAQNLSDFLCSWTFNVKYKVRDLKGPEKETYSVGEVISCSAMGNPIPKLEMKLNGKEVIKENGKKIDYKLGDELLEKKYVLVDCLASNPYENLRQSYNFTLTKPKHVSPGEVLLENKNWILILIVILIAVVLLLLIIIFLCWRKRKNSKNTHSKENSAQLMSKKDYPNEATA